MHWHKKKEIYKTGELTALLHGPQTTALNEKHAVELWVHEEVPGVMKNDFKIKIVRGTMEYLIRVFDCYSGGN